jgi:hypothetical protein
LIGGSLAINGASSSIFNLSGLSNLKEVGENLIIRDSDSLVNLHGLEQLQRIGQTLILRDNVTLTTMEQFQNWIPWWEIR